MQEVPIELEFDVIHDKMVFIKYNNLFIILKKCLFDLKYLFFVFVLLFILSKIFFHSLDRLNLIDLTSYIQYISDCKKSIYYNRGKIYNNHPYISVCISALNMEDYIEKNILSIINQSFQDFEIVIVDDGSNDKTGNIIKKIQSNDKRIKLLSHPYKLGVYRSRIETIFNSKSEYILLMDPDDMYSNENLFRKIYEYNKENNLDIIEFSVIHQIEGQERIFFPKFHYHNHYHQFDKNIINQPELSNILFYSPGTKKYSRTICRNIWNKIIRRKIFRRVNEYIGEEYYNDYIITTDDMLLNIITYQFATNYSNINLPGYLYIRRNNSMSRGGEDELKKIRIINYYTYFKMFYKYLRDYNKDIHFLFYEMKSLQGQILGIKNYNLTSYIPKQLNLIESIIQENALSNEFEAFLQNLSSFFRNYSF